MFTLSFTPSMKVGIVTEEARRGRVPEVQSSPGVMVVTSPGERVRQLLETFKLCRAQFSSAQLSSAQLWVLFCNWEDSSLTWLAKLRCSLVKFKCSWNCWSGKICLLPNFAGIELGLIWCLCSLCMCRLTVLFLVKDRWQNGQGTLMPWWRWRMWALRFVS